MWPHKVGLGVRCSYGVDGNANLDDISSFALEFPRKRDHQSRLNYVDGSYKELVSPQLSNDSDGSEDQKDYKQGFVKGASKTSLKSELIPRDIMKSLTIESAMISSTLAFDPTFGESFTTFSLKNKGQKTSTKVAAYAGGENGTIMHLAMMKGMGEDYFEKPTKIEFPSAVRQIITGQSKQNRVSEYILVRVTDKVFVLSCSIISGRFRVLIIGEIASSSLNNADFCDFAFCTRKNEFTIIDVHGCFSQWKITRSNKVVKLNETNYSLDNAKELSNWKRILPVESSMYVFSRSSITRFDLVNNTSKRLTTADSWSKIQAVSLIENNMFLLTSKEIIWFRVGNELERLISWKHYLNDDDPTLKLHVHGQKNNFICVSYSERHPLLFAFNFKLEGDKPIIFRDPYYFEKKSKNPLQQISLHDVSEPDEQDRYCLFEICTNLQISSSLYKSDIITLHTQAQKPVLETYDPKLNGRFHSLLPTHECDEHKQLSLIQDYARSLGEGPFKINKTKGSPTNDLVPYFSISEISPKLPLEVSDVSELDHMIEQLAGFYSQKGITLTSTIASLINSHTNLDVNDYSNSAMNLEDLQNILQSIYLPQVTADDRMRRILSIATIMLGASLIKANSEVLSGDLDSKLQSMIAEAPPQVEELLNDWDNLYEDDQVVNDIEPQSQVSQMPTINLSQRNPTSTPHRSQKRAHSQNVSQEVRSSQPFNTISSQKQRFKLSQSSQPGKRKKKRGFA